MCCESKDIGAAGAVASVDGHAGSAKRDGYGLVGGVGLSGVDKRTLVWCLLRVGCPELFGNGNIKTVSIHPSVWARAIDITGPANMTAYPMARMAQMDPQNDKNIPGPMNLAEF